MLNHLLLSVIGVVFVVQWLGRRRGVAEPVPAPVPE